LKNSDSYPFAPEYEGLNILEGLCSGRFEVAVAAHSDGSRYSRRGLTTPDNSLESSDILRENTREELMPAERLVSVNVNRSFRHE
jgi:hypothetical protein